MANYIKPTIAAAAAVICLAITACGSGASGSADPPAAIVSSTGPVSIGLRVDVSASTARRTLRRQYLAAGMKAVEAAIERGGRLSIAVFFARGLSHSIQLLDAPVPTPAEVGGVARAQQVIPIRNAAESALAEALSLAPRKPEVAKALTDLGGEGEGTDVAGSLADALAATRGQPHAVVVLLSDGEDAAFTGHYGSSPHALAARISPELPKVARDVTVALAGIGGTAKGANTKATERLLGAWRLACARTSARCYVTPDLNLTHLFG